MMIQRHIAAIGVVSCLVVPIAQGDSGNPMWLGGIPTPMAGEPISLSSTTLLAQAQADRHRAPYLSLRDSVLREIAKLPYEEGIKYGALTLLAAQPWSPVTSTVAAGAIKTEIIKDILFSVVRGIVNSDYVKGAMLNDPIRRKQVELAVRVVEGTWDLRGFLSDVTGILGMSDAELSNFLSTLPSSITDAMDASQAYMTTVSGIGFMQTVALELREECDFEAARVILQRANSMLKNDVLPKVVRELNDKIELIIGHRVGTFPEDLPVEWWRLPYRDEKFAEAMGDTYFWAAAAYRQAIRLAAEMPKLMRELDAAETNHRQEISVVERQFDETEEFLAACEFGEAYRRLNNIEDKYISRNAFLPFLSKDIAKSYGCWGWAEPRFNDLKTRYMQEMSKNAWGPSLADQLAADGRTALSQCKLDEARFALRQLGNVKQRNNDHCADKKSAELQKALDEIINRAICGGKTTAVAPPAPQAKSPSCTPAADSRMQKEALHARIGQYLKFRKDGGDQWHPDHTMRAGYSVGSAELKATPLELAAMAKLIDDYHAAYQRFWAHHEGLRPQLLKAIKDAEQRRDYPESSRIQQELRRLDGEASKAREEAIRRADEEFKAAIKQARALCGK